MKTCSIEDDDDDEDEKMDDKNMVIKMIKLM